MKVRRIYGLFGDLGSYKTALAVFLTRCLMEEYDVGCVTDIDLNLPNQSGYQVVEKVDFCEQVGNEVLDKVMLDDEIYTKADARMSLTEQNVFFSYKIAQARKSPRKAGGRGIGNFEVYTSQLVSMPDIRLFELTNVYVFCEQNDDESCSYEFVTSDGNYGDGNIPKSFFEDVSFPFYDTDEKVMPLGIEKLRYSVMQYSPVRRNEYVDNIVKVMLDSGRFAHWVKPSDVDKFEVDNYLYRLGKPDKVSKPVFDEIRVRLKRKEMGI